ncbi:MAG TPA: SMP-30/gluconolactonase/LRE family protein [Vicinamibacterales bacterium]|nr:SMP-30/gluconolactonase/LRE family protein [Vicinamibacterales bacterium]
MTRGAGIRRRQLLEMAAATLGFATTGCLRDLVAQNARRIDRYAAELDAIVSTSEPIRELGSGYGVAGNPAEGPVWVAAAGYLLFNSMQRSQRLKYSPATGVTVAAENTQGANGLTLDLQGRLISAERDTRRVTRTEADGRVTVVAATYQGKPLPPPNDVVVKSDGAIYFTAPGSGLGPNDAPVGVYRVSPGLDAASLLAEGLIIPNGLAFSPDEDVLFVTDSGPRQVVAFDMLANGSRANQPGRVFADLSGPEPGGTDGMKVDTLGNVYVGGAGGLYVLDPEGKKLGRIVHGLDHTTNVAFGGQDWKSLYFTTRSTLNVVNIKVPGTPVPPRRRLV